MLLLLQNLIITCEGKRFKEEATRYMKRLTYKQKLDVKAYELSYEAGFSVSENSEYPDIFQFSHPDLEAPIHLASEDKELFLQTVEGFVRRPACCSPLIYPLPPLTHLNIFVHSDRLAPPPGSPLRKTSKATTLRRR